MSANKTPDPHARSPQAKDPQIKDPQVKVPGTGIPRTRYLAWIRAIWREKGGLIVVLFLLTLLSSAVAVSYPYLSKLLLDTIQGQLRSEERRGG